MAKKLSSVVGIDIGSQRIKICEFKTQGKEPVITALGMIDTPEGAVDHTGIFNSDAVGAAIKQVLSESGASTQQVVVSIAGQASVLVRTLEVPKMNPAELKDHMQWEVNRNVPFAESTVVSDFKPLGDEDPASQNMEVVMAIAPQSAIDTVLASVKRGGRVAAAIDVEPLSIARAINRNYENLADRTVCVVDMGAKSTAINIFHGSRLLMPRTVPIGGELFTKAIADALNLPFSEAEAIKVTRAEVPENAAQSLVQTADPFSVGATTQEFQPYNPFADDPLPLVTDNPLDPAPMADPVSQYSTPGFAAEAAEFSSTALGDGPIEVEDAVVEEVVEMPMAQNLPSAMGDTETMRLYNAMAPIVEEFVSEVRRSIDYFQSRGGEVHRVELCGGGTKLRGLAAHLTQLLDIECDAFDPMRRLSVNAKKVAPGFAEEHRQEFAVAVGNGLYIFFD